MVMAMSAEINKQSIYNNLLFNREIKYDEAITFYPIRMKYIVQFQMYQIALTLRKDSIFNEKEIIKMSYLDFIKYACNNEDLAIRYKIPTLPFYYNFILELLYLSCGETVQIRYNTESLDFYINDELVTSEMFDDIRKILILQNDIDFDVDEFINRDTLDALEKAKEFESKKRKEKAELEDYIDSLIISLKVTEEYVENMTIRKFWRYITRINMHDNYIIDKTADRSGMVTFKDPIKSWMTSIELDDKYAGLKADEGELRGKIK